MVIETSWGYILLCLLAGGLAAGGLYFVGPKVFRGAQQWLLAVLRFLSVSGIAFLLVAPVVRQKVSEQREPLVVLVRDCSLSVQSSADSAFSFEALKARLGGRCRWVEVADTLHTRQTDLSQMLIVPPDAEAVVLASDGIYNRGVNPVGAAERLGIPVHTVALGDTVAPCDASLAGLRVGRVAMSETLFPVELVVNATRLQGQQAKLEISNGRGEVVGSMALAYDDDEFSTQAMFSLPAGESGMQRFEARLSISEDEKEVANNVMVFYVDVIEARRKVAILAHAPHPDVAALKRALDGNPNYEAEVVLAGDVERGKQQFKAEDYQLAVLHNLPSREHPSIEFVGDLPRMFVIGRQTDLERFNALQTGLEISSGVDRADELSAMYNEGFGLFSFPKAEASVLEQLPPLVATFGQVKAAAGVQSLFTARLGSLPTQQPLVAVGRQGDGRQVFVRGEGLWRWRLAEYALHGSHEAVDHMLSQLVVFAAMKHKQGRLQVEAARSYPSDMPIMLRAELYNENYELTNGPGVKLHIEGDSVNADYAFLRDASSYQLKLPQLKEGVYRYRASSDDGAEAEGTFAVETSQLEWVNMVANHALLRAISEATGGETVLPADLSPLEASLSALKPTIHTHTRYADLSRLAVAMVLLLLLLGAEWVLRKYYGEL